MDTHDKIEVAMAASIVQDSQIVAPVQQSKRQRKQAKKPRPSQCERKVPTKFYEQLQSAMPNEIKKIRELLEHNVRPVFRTHVSQDQPVTVPSIPVSKWTEQISIVEYNDPDEKSFKDWASELHSNTDLLSVPSLKTSSDTTRISSDSIILHGSTKGFGVGLILSPKHINAFEVLADLIRRYSQFSHMGVLDPSYSYFITAKVDGALCFKVKANVCLVSGDPLCAPHTFTSVLEEFAVWRKTKKYGIAFIGASNTFTTHTNSKGWAAMHFATERVINPMQNLVLEEHHSKSIIRQSRNFLNPDKGGMKLGIYIPSVNNDHVLQHELETIYQAWRSERNKNSTNLQTFVTVYDPFSVSSLMVFIYTRDSKGVPNGFAALRRLGAKRGFHIDPCIAAPDAPKALPDLLFFAAIAYLQGAGCTYLSLGYEPLLEPAEITGIPSWLTKVTEATYRTVLKELPLRGKKTYNDKWYPDEAQSRQVYLVFPDGMPSPRVGYAILKFCNLSCRDLAMRKWRKCGWRLTCDDVRTVHLMKGIEGKDGREKEEC